MRRFSVTQLASRFALATACLALAGVVAPSLASADQQHRSYLRVGETGSGAARQITLGLNKSMIVELPREVREVMVSNPDKIDAVLQTSTRAYLIGKAAGEANIIFVDKDGRQVVSLEVTVERDLVGARDDLLNSLIRGANIRVQTVSGSVILTGTVQNPIDATRAGEIATQIIGVDRQTRRQPRRRRPASNAERRPGRRRQQPVDIDAHCGRSAHQHAHRGGQGAGAAQGLRGGDGAQYPEAVRRRPERADQLGQFRLCRTERSSLPHQCRGQRRPCAVLEQRHRRHELPARSGLGNSPAGFPNLDPTVGNTSGFAGQWTAGQSRVQSVLRALEQDGLLHTLAEPNLTAISGETANFLAGGEFPIPIAQQLGTISVEFKKFGIGLAFTPVVMSEGRISLKVSTEVSELSNQGAVILSNIAIPALKVRRAETVVELPSGGSLVMAGLLSDQSKQALSGYPGLKNLPVLGTLFRSRDFLKNETELVVLVTPYVVKPVARSELAQPDDGFGWASDVNTDLIGQMNRVYGRHPERAPVGRFDGDVGFIVE